MNFEQFRAKVFMLSVWKELDQVPSTSNINSKISNNTIVQEAINELKLEFGSKELEGVKILAKFL